MNRLVLLAAVMFALPGVATGQESKSRGLTLEVAGKKLDVSRANSQTYYFGQVDFIRVEGKRGTAFEKVKSLKDHGCDESRGVEATLIVGDEQFHMSVVVKKGVSQFVLEDSSGKNLTTPLLAKMMHHSCDEAKLFALLSSVDPAFTSDGTKKKVQVVVFTLADLKCCDDCLFSSSCPQSGTPTCTTCQGLKCKKFGGCP